MPRWRTPRIWRRAIPTALDNSDRPRNSPIAAQILIARANSLIAHASAPQLGTQWYDVAAASSSDPAPVGAHAALAAAAAIADAAVGGSAMP